MMMIPKTTSIHATQPPLSPSTDLHQIPPSSQQNTAVYNNNTAKGGGGGGSIGRQLPSPKRGRSLPFPAINAINDAVAAPPLGDIATADNDGKQSVGKEMAIAVVSELHPPPVKWAAGDVVSEAVRVPIDGEQGEQTEAAAEGTETLPNSKRRLGGKPLRISLILVLCIECLLIAGVFAVLVAVASVRMTHTTRALVEERITTDLVYAKESILGPILAAEKVAKAHRIRYVAGSLMKFGGGGIGRELCSDASTSWADNVEFLVDGMSTILSNVPAIGWVYTIALSNTFTHQGPPRNNNGSLAEPTPPPPLHQTYECGAGPDYVYTRVNGSYRISNHSITAEMAKDGLRDDDIVSVIDNVTDYRFEDYLFRALSYVAFAWVPFIYVDPYTGSSDLLLGSYSPVYINRTLPNGTVETFLADFATGDENENGEINTDEVGRGRSSANDAKKDPALTVVSMLGLDLRLAHVSQLLADITPFSTNHMSHTSLYDLKGEEVEGGGGQLLASSMSRQSGSSRSSSTSPQTSIAYDDAAGSAVKMYDANDKMWRAGHSPSSALNAAYREVEGDSFAATDGDGAKEVAIRYTSDGRIVSSIRIVTHSHIDLVIIQSTPEMYYIQPVVALRTMMIAMGVCAAFVVVALCVVIVAVVRKALADIQEGMLLAALLKNDKVRPVRSVMTEIDELCRAFMLMNEKLGAARAYMPQSMLLGSSSEGDEDFTSHDDEDGDRGDALDDDDDDEGSIYNDSLHGSHNTNDHGGGRHYQHHRRHHRGPRLSLGILSSGRGGGGGAHGGDSNTESTTTAGTASTVNTARNRQSPHSPQHPHGRGFPNNSHSTHHHNSTANPNESTAGSKRQQQQYRSTTTNGNAAARQPVERRNNNNHHNNHWNQTVAGLQTKRVTVMCINTIGFHKRCVDGLALNQRSADLTALVHAHAQQHRGVIDSLHGDHFVIGFNAVKHNAQGPLRAVQCALALVEQLCPMTLSMLHGCDDKKGTGGGGAAVSDWVGGHPSVTTLGGASSSSGGAGLGNASSASSLHCPLSIGIATGKALVGRLGSADLKRFSIVGKSYSRAAKLEALCKAMAREEEEGGVLRLPSCCMEEEETVTKAKLGKNDVPRQGETAAARITRQTLPDFAVLAHPQRSPAPSSSAFFNTAVPSQRTATSAMNTSPNTLNNNTANVAGCNANGTRRSIVVGAIVAPPPAAVPLGQPTGASPPPTHHSTGSASSPPSSPFFTGGSARRHGGGTAAVVTIGAEGPLMGSARAHEGRGQQAGSSSIGDSRTSGGAVGGLLPTLSMMALEVNDAVSPFDNSASLSQREGGGRSTTPSAGGAHHPHSINGDAHHRHPPPQRRSNAHMTMSSVPPPRVVVPSNSAVAGNQQQHSNGVSGACTPSYPLQLPCGIISPTNEQSLFPTSLPPPSSSAPAVDASHPSSGANHPNHMFDFSASAAPASPHRVVGPSAAAAAAAAARSPTHHHQQQQQQQQYNMNSITTSPSTIIATSTAFGDAFQSVDLLCGVAATPTAQQQHGHRQGDIDSNGGRKRDYYDKEDAYSSACEGDEDGPDDGHEGSPLHGGGGAGRSGQQHPSVTKPRTRHTGHSPGALPIPPTINVPRLSILVDTTVTTDVEHLFSTQLQLMARLLGPTAANNNKKGGGQGKGVMGGDAYYACLTAPSSATYSTNDGGTHCEGKEDNSRAETRQYRKQQQQGPPPRPSEEGFAYALRPLMPSRAEKTDSNSRQHQHQHASLLRLNSGGAEAGGGEEWMYQLQQQQGGGPNGAMTTSASNNNHLLAAGRRDGHGARQGRQPDGEEDQPMASVIIARPADILLEVNAAMSALLEGLDVTRRRSAAVSSYCLRSVGSSNYHCNSSDLRNFPAMRDTTTGTNAAAIDAFRHTIRAIAAGARALIADSLSRNIAKMKDVEEEVFSPSNAAGVTPTPQHNSDKTGGPIRRRRSEKVAAATTAAHSTTRPLFFFPPPLEAHQFALGFAALSRAESLLLSQNNQKEDHDDDLWRGALEGATLMARVTHVM